MRIAKYGRVEAAQYTLLGLGLAALSAFGLSEWVSPWLGWPLAVVFTLLALFVLSFFRDPDRAAPGDALDILSPADGTVTHVETGDATCSDFIEGKSHMLGIFLSVFNVHVNRAPLDGNVEYLRYKAGKFLDARHPDCTTLNEQQVIGITCDKADDTKVVVKQIAGLIARRIVCPLQPNDRVVRGERMGMIKFGSRTEIWIDASKCDVEWKVKIGDKVNGSSTILGRLIPKN